jgi:hypothetical protein
MLVHERLGQIDRTFGTWFVYGQNGKPMWFTLQGGVWETPTTLVGDVYETSAAPTACNPSNPAICPSVFDPFASQEVKKVGRFQLEFGNSYTATLKFFGAPPYSDSRTIELERLGAR